MRRFITNALALLALLCFCTNADCLAGRDIEIGKGISPRKSNSPTTGNVIRDTDAIWANSVYPKNAEWRSEPGIPYNPWYIGREQLCMHQTGPFDPFGIVVDYRLGDFDKVVAWARKEKVEFRDIGIAGAGMRIASIKPPNSKNAESARPLRLVRRVNEQAFFVNVRHYPGNQVPYLSPQVGKESELLRFLRRTGFRATKFEHSLYQPSFEQTLSWMYYQVPVVNDELSFWIKHFIDQDCVKEVTFWPAPFLPGKIMVKCFSQRDRLLLLKVLGKYEYFIQGGASFTQHPAMEMYRITVPEAGEAEAIKVMRSFGLDASFAVIPGDSSMTTTLNRRFSERELRREGGKAFDKLDATLSGVLRGRFGNSSVTSLGGGFFRVNNIYQGPKFLTTLDKSGWERVRCLASVTVRGRACFVRVQFDVDGTSKGDSSKRPPLLSLFKEFPNTDEMETMEAERIVNEVVSKISEPPRK